jgi:hypothetical protein
MQWEILGRNTYKTTSLRGLPAAMTGKRAKHMTKQARAPRLQAPKISRRSHRLTMSRRLAFVAAASQVKTEAWEK